MRMKKCLSILLAVVMIATMITSLPITANAVEVDAAATAVNQSFTVNNANDLTTAISTINAATEESKFVIDLKTDLENVGISITNGNAEVTIIGNGKTISATGSAVYVSGGAKVILGDDTSALTLTSADNNDTPGIVHVLKDSSCTMKNQVTLRDHDGQNYLGGGVTVEGGTFVMDGGTITKCGIAGTEADNNGGSVCYGGGVAVFNGGHFTMNGGTIDHCYAITNFVEENHFYQNCYSGIGGGVFVTDGSEFIMNGGTISKCSASNFGGGVAMTLSDIETEFDPVTGEDIINPKTGKPNIDYGNPRSNVTINGGLISENNAKYGAGVFASGLIFAFAKAFSKLPFDFGTPENPGLYINRGENKSVEISSNTASDTGGGVLAIGLKDPKRAVIKNTDISYNHAKSGAGISVYKYWTKATIENCHIHDNVASTLGGGIYLDDNKDLEAGTTIKNTVIENNTAGEKGGGIYYKKESVLNIEGADIIQNNTVDEKDNNLYFQGTDYPVNVTDSLEGSRIGITDAKLFEDALDDTAAEAESSDSLTAGFKAQNPSLIPDGAFTSDHESWYVDYGAIKEITVTTGESYYKYSANKYTVQSRTDSGISCQGEKYSVKANTFTSGIATNPDVFKNEVLSRFPSSKYEDYGDNVDQNGMHWYYRLNKESDQLVYVVFTNQDNVQILPGGKAVLKSSTGHQSQYAASGEFVYEYLSKATRDDIIYSSDSTPLYVNYNTAISEDKEIYDYDELGHIISKTVISKASEELVGTETTETLDYTNEVRLVRKETVDYHINNDDIIAASYNDNNDETDDDIFTDEITAAGTTITLGEKITSFYTVPEVVSTPDSTCPYIFKGWYYDKNNENDTRPVKFGTDTYTAGRDIYAHWIEVENVAKATEDTHILPGGGNTYGGFDLMGVQIRKERTIDPNYGYEHKPGGMRFITSLSKKVVNEINALDDKTDIEYGFVTTTDKNEAWINYHKGSGRKLQYVSKTANGINTLDPEGNDTYFDFARNINCTSKQSSSAGVVKWDHCNFDNYLLYTLVVTYEEETSNKSTNVLARPYIHYTDANGLERVAYSDYNGTSKMLGGCYTNYEELTEQEAKA